MTRQPVIERFWSKVDVRGPDECWPWTAGRQSKGYGAFRLPKSTVGAHRFSLELALGRPLAPGEWALHSCDNPPCCNPAHLRPGLPVENSADRDSRGRGARVMGEANHLSVLTEDQVREIRLLAEEGFTQASIGEAYGIGRANVSAIVLRKSWRHVNV